MGNNVCILKSVQSLRWACPMTGNNVFGEAVRYKLLKMKNSYERASYVLMKRVHPLVYRNYPIAANCPVELTEMVSELGIFGCLLAYVIFPTCSIVVWRCGPDWLRERFQYVLFWKQQLWLSGNKWSNNFDKRTHRTGAPQKIIFPKLPFPLGYPGLTYMVSWVHLSPCPKRHLDRFSRYCRAHGWDQQTDTQTGKQADRQTDRPWERKGEMEGRDHHGLQPPQSNYSGFVAEQEAASLHSVHAMRPNNHDCAMSKRKPVFAILSVTPQPSNLGVYDNNPFLWVMNELYVQRLSMLMCCCSVMETRSCLTGNKAIYFVLRWLALMKAGWQPDTLFLTLRISSTVGH